MLVLAPAPVEFMSHERTTLLHCIRCKLSLLAPLNLSPSKTFRRSQRCRPSLVLEHALSLVVVVAVVRAPLYVLHACSACTKSCSGRSLPEPPPDVQFERGVDTVLLAEAGRTTEAGVS